MGEGSSGEGNADCGFFFKLVGGIAEEYPIVFNGRGSNKPHSQEYRNFKEKWGFIDVVYQVADEKAEKVAQVNQMYLNDFMQYLSWMIDKSQVDEVEERYQESLRKARRGK